MMEDSQVIQQPKKKGKRKWTRLLLWSLLLLIAFPFILLFISQIPIVQQWGSQQLAKYLSNQFNTEVNVGGFRVKWTDKIELQSVLIRDLDQDSMIYVGSLDADLDKPIRGFIDGKVNIEGLTLTDGFLNIKFKKDALQNNLNAVFKGPVQAIDSTTNQINSDISIKADEKDRYYLLDILNLNRIRVRNYHEAKGKEELFYVGKGKLTNVSLNMNETILMSDEIWLENPVVDITNFEYDKDRYRELFVLPFMHDADSLADLFPLTLTSKKLYVSEGELRLKNLRNAPAKMTPDDQLDWNYLDVSHIEISADSFYMNDWMFGAELHSLKAETSSGFNIVDASAQKIRVTEQLASIDGLSLQSSMSTMQGDLKFIYDEYPDFRDFANEVRFDFQSQNSELGIDDLITFSPKLKNNPFFRENNYELISLNGRILGYVNNLKGRSLNMKLGNKFVVNGLIDVRDFTDPNRTRINLNLQELRTDMKTIESLVPNLKLPDNFDVLGDVRLTGEFNGLLKDFIAFGDIKTEIGTASFNMNLNFVNGVKDAVYDGRLDLKDFNLGKWTSNPNFGIISLNTSIAQGRGLTQETATGRLSADIGKFEFKGYSYENAKFSGLLQNELINGQFAIKDDNIDLNWEGVIKINDSPDIDVRGSIGYLDLKALRLVQDDLVIATDFNIDITDIDPDRFTGDIYLKNLNVGHQLDSMDHIDSLHISSVFTADSNKTFTVSSEMLEAQVNGQFRILSLPNYFTNYFLEFNPEMARKLGLQPKDNLPYANFDMNFDVRNSQGLLAYVTDQMDTLRDLHVEGRLEAGQNFFLKGNIPILRVGDAELNNLHLYANADGAYTNIVTSHEGMKIGKFNFSPLTVFADLEKDTMQYVFNEVEFQTYFDQINVEGKLYVSEGFWQTQLFDSELQIFGEDWTINDNNFMRFGPGTLLVRNLNLNHENEYIKIKSINNDKGLALDLQDLPLQRVNDLINYDRIKFSGLLSGSIRAKTLKNFDEISGNLVSPKILINGDDFGDFNLTAKSESPGEPIFIDMKMINGEQRLLGLAEILAPNKARGEKGTINSQLTIEHFPANIIEYFIINGLSNTTGYFHGSISAVGALTDPVIEGDINIPSSSFKIDILGTTYYLEDQHVHVNSNLIDASGVVLRDRYLNTAQIVGGVTHHNLAKLGFSAQLQSDEILILETTQKDNDIYYGTVFADLTANFGGTVQRPVIRVEAENKPNSDFVINNDRDEQSGGLDFIIFDFDTIKTTGVNDNLVLGVDLTIDMTVNPDLKVQIILDESTRDIIKGTGNGDLIFKYSPAGEMSLFGDYTIDQGEYLFTYTVGNLLPVNKPFTIRKGSKLNWTDDPFEADVDIRADYSLLASPYNLISDRSSTSLAEEAKQKTDVVLELILRGPMLQPDINFNIEMPELTGQLKSAVEIELARIESDQTELQSQAASLIIFRDFVSPQLSASSSVSVVANTLSEFLSNQLSYYLSGLVSFLVNEIGFIDDIQFDVGYRLPTGEFSSAGTVYNSELGVSTRIIMFDRRLEASIKGDYVNTDDANSGLSTNYFNTDLELDYILTSDRRWRLRAYLKQDQFYNDRRSRGGFGLTWRREYDNLETYRAAIKEQKMRLKEQKSQ
jgi:hypothetical protein